MVNPLENPTPQEAKEYDAWHIDMAIKEFEQNYGEKYEKQA